MSNLLSLDFETFKDSFKTRTHHTQVLFLNMYIDNDAQLKQLYVQAANAHNCKLANDPHYYDAGFDLFLPSSNSFKTEFMLNDLKKVDFKVRCAAEMRFLNRCCESDYIDNPCTCSSNCDCSSNCNCNDIHIGYYSPFYLHPRSSLSKTPLRLANSTGIIDAGYRGNLIGMFDCIQNNKTVIEKYTCDSYARLLQICAPDLAPIFVNIVDTELGLGVATNRGLNGLGSTGI